MFGLIKIAGVSAVLSAGLVTAYAPAPETGAKLYQDRIAQDASPAARPVRLAAAETTGSVETGSPACAGQAWPNIAPACLSAATGTPARAKVRTITIETRDAPNVSTLVRLPVEAARR